MAIRNLRIDELCLVSGAGRNGRDDDRSASRSKSRSKGPSSNKIYGGVSNECLADIAFGAANGLVGGGLGAVVGVVSGARKSCTAGNNNTNGGGKVSPGQCTW